MALLFADGSDQTAGAGDGKYSSGGTITSSGREGNGLTGTAQKNLAGNYSALIAGFAWKGPLGRSPIFYFGDGAAQQVRLCVLSDGSLQVQRSSIGTVLGTSAAGLVAANSWNYYEIETTFTTGATGTVIVRLNRVAVLTLTGVQTSSSGNAYANECIWYIDSFDDIYVCDNSGTQNNTFLGDTTIFTLFPTGPGHLTQLTHNGASTNWQCVNQAAPDGDTTYVNPTGINQEDVYAMGALSGSAGAVQAIQVTASVNGPGSFCFVVSDGTNDSASATIPAGSGYQVYTQAYDVDPITGSPWSPAILNARQFGVRVLS